MATATTDNGAVINVGPTWLVRRGREARGAGDTVTDRRYFTCTDCGADTSGNVIHHCHARVRLPATVYRTAWTDAWATWWSNADDARLVGGVPNGGA